MIDTLMNGMINRWLQSVTPECRVAETRWVGKLLTSIMLLIGSNNTAARLKTINNIFIYCLCWNDISYLVIRELNFQIMRQLSLVFLWIYSLLSTSILSFISSANLPADRVLWEIISTLSSCCACANGSFEFKFDAIGETTSTTPLCWLLLLLLLLFLILSMNIVGMFGLILLERLYDMDKIALIKNLSRKDEQNTFSLI